MTDEMKVITLAEALVKLLDGLLPPEGKTLEGRSICAQALRRAAELVEAGQ